MKKAWYWLLIPCVLLLAIFIYRLTEPSGYSIIEDNGEFYVTFNVPITKYFGGGYGPEVDATIRFDSLDEMKNDFQNGTFSREELYRLSQFFPKDEKGRIRIPDLNNLYDVTLPNRICTNGIVAFVIGGYGIHLADRENLETQSMIRCVSEAYIQEEITIWKPGTTDTSYKYTIDCDNKVLYVDESMELVDDDSNPGVKKQRFSYHIYGDAGELSFYLFLDYLPYRLTVEEISAFGLVPYEG